MKDTDNSSSCSQPHDPALMIVPAQDSQRGGATSAPRNESKSDGARRIEQCIAYMQKHLNQPLQVARLARMANTSPSHFFVLFKRCTGSSPIDYFIHLRMQQACRLLAAGAMSVKEIAANLGYEDPFYFSRVFKAIHGICPSEYRHMMEQAPDDGAVPGLGKAPSPQPLCISELLENEGVNGKLLCEKDSAASSTQAIYMLH